MRVTIEIDDDELRRVGPAVPVPAPYKLSVLSRCLGSPATAHDLIGNQDERQHSDRGTTATFLSFRTQREEHELSSWPIGCPADLFHRIPVSDQRCLDLVTLPET